MPVVGELLWEVLDKLHWAAGPAGRDARRAEAAAALEFHQERKPTNSEVEGLQAGMAAHFGLLLERASSPVDGLDDLVDLPGEDLVVHGVDARAVAYLAGEGARSLADQWAQEADSRVEVFARNRDARALLSPWLPAEGALPEIVRLTAVSIWLRDVLPQLEADRRSGAPAVSAAVLDRAQQAWWTAGRRIERFGEQQVVSRRGAVVATLQPSECSVGVPADVFRGMRSVNRFVGHLLFRWLVEMGYRQALDQAVRDPRRVRVQHGFTGLAAALGLHSRKAADELRTVLSYLQHAHLRLPRGEVGGLAMWSTEPAGPGRPEVLNIVLADALLPTYVNTLPKGGASQRYARTLVPVPPKLPRLIGHRRHHAALVLFQQLVLREMRLGAEELLHHRGILLTRVRLHDLAHEAGVPAKIVEPVIRAWCDLADPDAFLLPTEEVDRFELGPSYAKESLLLEGAALRIAKGREYQARSRFARTSRRMKIRRTGRDDQGS